MQSSEARATRGPSRRSGDVSARPLARLLDLGVYAPLGFLLNRDQTVADLAAAGRKQIAFSRSLGRAALKGLARTSSGTTPAPRATQSSAKPGTGSTSETAAVEDYDSMSARDIIAKMPTYSLEQREWIRQHEAATKNRVTVTRALDAQAPRPSQR